MAHVAVKIMETGDLTAFKQEVNFNRMLHHPNVVRFFGAAVNHEIGQVPPPPSPPLVLFDSVDSRRAPRARGAGVPP